MQNNVNQYIGIYYLYIIIPLYKKLKKETIMTAGNNALGDYNSALSAYIKANPGSNEFICKSGFKILNQIS